jgi:cytochrome c-type biogenesis protein CcmE
MERSPERKRLWLAVAASIFVHLLVAFSLAAFNRATAPLPTPEEEKPAELTMMDLSALPTATPTPANPALRRD